MIKIFTVEQQQLGFVESMTYKEDEYKKDV